MPRADSSSSDAERVEQALHGSLERLQRDVAGEAVRDDDVRVTLEQRPPLGVPAEAEIRGAEELVRLERQLVALLGLLADRQEPHLRIRHLEDLLGEHGAHVRELDEVLGPPVGVRARRR